MMTNDERIRELLKRVDALYAAHKSTSDEIRDLRKDILYLQNEVESNISPDTEDRSVQPPITMQSSVSVVAAATQLPPQPIERGVTTTNEESQTTHAEARPEASLKAGGTLSSRTQESIKPAPKKTTDWEKVIGENLINKIGILITVIGVAIGMKYSIEHNLINPLTRVVIGYAFGIGVLLFGMKLRASYLKYSAVLVSGAVAMLYFVSYAAYDFYGLIPQIGAFAIMLLITTFGVVASLSYNMPIIAHLGLVGAYGIPFLLSDGSGRVAILYSYMAIINAGILAISIFKDWKSLLYSAFFCTWLIFCSWYVSGFSHDTHTSIAFAFSTIFFVEFYVAVLVYKFRTGIPLRAGEALLLILNAVITYSIGYSLLEYPEWRQQYQGLYTAINGVIHFSVAAIIRRSKIADETLFTTAIGLVISFLTITIPVQLNGVWVSTIWAIEAAVLFGIGRRRSLPLYETASYILAALAFISVNDDWQNYFRYYKGSTDLWLTPFLNTIFLSSVLVSAGYAAMLWLNTKYPRPTAESNSKKRVLQWHEFFIGATILALIVSSYASVHLEIGNCFHQYYHDSQIRVSGNGIDGTMVDGSYPHFGVAWQVVFGLVYSLILIICTPRLTMSDNSRRTLNIALLILMSAGMLGLVGIGLYTANMLQGYYQGTAYGAQYYHTGIAAMMIRYLMYGCAALTFWSGYRIARAMKEKSSIIYTEVLGCGVIFFCISNELIKWNDMLSTSSDLTKIGLSILWGIYAIVLIIAGIRLRKKHLRVLGIVVFTLALIKLFLYDSEALSTIYKTILFVALGIFLLLVSFLYNKFTARIFGAPEQQESAQQSAKQTDNENTQNITIS